MAGRMKNVRMCQRCGNPITSKYGKKYCSYSCAGASQKRFDDVKKWTPRHVKCEECGSDLKRKVFHPVTGEPITAFFCNFKCRAIWQRRKKPVDADWLYQKYIVENLDCSQIGKIVNRDPKSVWNWLKDFGIQTRSRGDCVAAGAPHAFKKGEPSRFLGHEGLRGEKSPAWQGGITPERQALYASDKWREASKVVYARANKCCERCGIPQAKALKLNIKLHIHHIVGFKTKRLRCEPSNLALLCKPCHLFVHSKQNISQEFRRAA